MILSTYAPDYDFIGNYNFNLIGTLDGGASFTIGIF